jgi:Tol biopolymer transport system component
LFSAHDAAKDNAVWSLQQLELKTRRVSQFPNSQGLRAPAYSPDGRYVAAISANPANRLMLFDVRAQHWTELAHATWLYVPPHWSRDSQYVYAQDLGGIDQPVFRVRISDHKTETVTSLKQFARADATAYSLAGLTPDGSPLASLQRSPSDIYALDVDFP